MNPRLRAGIAYGQDSPDPRPSSVRPTRDLRLDFFRGLSLLFIFIDHIPGNPLAYFTLRNLNFSDAAEVFIFISGYTAALVYGRSLAENGPLFCTLRIYRRAWQLYLAHIFLFVIFIAALRYADVLAQKTLYLDGSGLEGAADFVEGAPRLLTLGAVFLEIQPMVLNILPIYIVLLAPFPIVLMLMARWRWLPLAISGAVYILTLRHGPFHDWPSPETWYFSPFAWQFLFLIGATAGYAHLTGRRPFPVARQMAPAAMVATILITVVSITWTLHRLDDSFPALFAHHYSVDKHNLAPLRLLSFICLAIATAHFVRLNSPILGNIWTRPVTLCGQHSLYIFCLGALLSVAGRFFLVQYPGHLVVLVGVNLFGIGALMVAALLLEWLKMTYLRAARGGSVSTEALRAQAVL